MQEQFSKFCHHMVRHLFGPEAKLEGTWSHVQIYLGDKLLAEANDFYDAVDKAGFAVSRLAAEREAAVKE